MKRLYTLMLIAMLTAWASAKTVTVTVDDASKVHMYDNNYKDYVLNDGANPIEVEFGVYEYTFEPVGVAAFTSITFNGQPMNQGMFGYRTYNVLADGTEIVINARQPEANYTYRLEYTADNGVWTRATVETMEGTNPVYTEVPIVDNTITVKAGSTVCLYADDPASWDVTRITDPSGNEMFWSAGTSIDVEPYNAYFVATADGGAVVTTARRKTVVNVDITINITGYYPTLSITHGDALGSSAFEPVTGLHEGANTLTLPNDHIVYVLSTDATEKTVTYRKGAGTDEKKAGFDKISRSYYIGPFDNGGEVNIVIEGGAPVVETFDATLTVADPADVKAIYTYWSATAPERNEILDATLTAGSNTLKVPVDNSGASVRLWLVTTPRDGMETVVRYRTAADAEWYDATQAADDVYAVSVFSNGTSEIEVLYTEPRKATVSFTLRATDAESDGVKVTDVTVDGVAADFTGEPLEVAEGATVTFKVEVPDDVTFTVTAGAETLEATDGVYTVTAGADTQIEVTYTASTGIGTITAAHHGQATAWYDLSGRPVNPDVLAAGIYVRVAGGKAEKVAVR